MGKKQGATKRHLDEHDRDERISAHFDRLLHPEKMCRHKEEVTLDGMTRRRKRDLRR